MGLELAFNWHKRSENKLKYQVPVCDCGSRLVYWQEYMYEVHTPITTNGLLSLRGIKQIDTGVLGAWERLHCPDCLNEYVCEKDSNGRILRGKKWSY